MARRCDICDKGVVAGVKYSHAHGQTRRTWAPNIRKVRAIVDGAPKRIRVCTRCLRSGKVERAI